MPNLRFGKMPARRNPNTLLLGNVFHTGSMPTIPDVFYNGDQFPKLKISTPMFRNDVDACCVTAARAHQTLRFEAKEQNRVINISDTDVYHEWQSENGHTKNGLYMLDSLECWRKGWSIGGKKYQIDVFARVSTSNIDHVKAGIYLLNGLAGGFMLPYAVTNNPDNTELWKVVSGPGAGTDPSNGHCMYVLEYNHIGPVLITWSRKQQVTWGWFIAYCDELYGICDALDSWITHGKPGIDVPLVRSYLKQLAA